MKVTSVSESGYPWLIELEDNSKFLLSQNILVEKRKIEVGDDVTVELAKVPVYSDVKIPFAAKVTRKAKEALTV